METQLAETAMKIPRTGIPKKHALCYESTAMKTLGLTRNAFRKLKIQPTKVVPNPYWRSGLYAYLFDRKSIEALKDSHAVLALKAKKPKPVDYASKFIRKYGSPVNAVRDAAWAMFNLNRYCKHPQCSKNSRSEIYELKNRLIRELHARGYCTKAFLHQRHMEGLVCYSCEGSGESFFNSDGRLCRRCGGTGFYKPPTTIGFYAFEFSIKNERFMWHQPLTAVDFEVNIDESITPTELNETMVKPLEIPRRKLTEAKALVRWFVSGSALPPSRTELVSAV